MKTLWLLLIPAGALALVVIGLVVLKRAGLRRAGASEPWPFYVRRPLSQPEQVLYHRLIRALPNHIVLAQVQVSRVLGVKKGAKFNEWNNRISRLSYDFVVCGKDSAVIAAIELDDRSHQSRSRVEADERKNKASADAGLRLIRWQVGSLPDEEAIQREFIAPPSDLHSDPSTRTAASSKSAA